MSEYESQVLLALNQIIMLLQRGQESRSSVEVSTSTRGVDIKAKSYADGLIDQAGVEAVDAYVQARDAINQRGVDAFEQTVKSLKR